jgi:YqaJ-like viral recombinase domain
MSLDRDEWLARRLTAIGASDVAAARHDIYGGSAKVVGIRIGLEDPDPIKRDRAERGHRWERPVADGVLAHYGLYVHGEQLHLAHPTQPRWMATPDGLLSPLPEATPEDLVAGLEIKTREIGAAWQWDAWETQAGFGCLVSGLPRWLLAVATIEKRLDPVTFELVERVVDVRYRWVEPTPFELAELGELADWLWSWVEKGELPPAESASALPWVKAANIAAGQTCPDCEGGGRHRGGGRRKLCARCDGKGVANVDQPADIDDLADAIERREELRAAIDAAQAEADLIEARLRERLGPTTETFTTDEIWRVRCGQPIRKFLDHSEERFIAKHGKQHPELLKTVLDREAAKAALPDDYEALKVTTSDRRLTTKQMRRP